MQLTTILCLTSAGMGMIGFAWMRQPVIALAMVFSFVYTVFDKVFPALLPEPVVTACALVHLVLTLVFCWQLYRRRKSN